MNEEMVSIAAALADRYRIERELGQGGMATVYLAEDFKHRRLVAIKVLRPELAAALGSDRFLREIETTANLRHPHILPLFDSGEAGGFLFYVMPFVEGESLRDRLTREKQLPVDDAVQIAREVADALSYAHGRGVIHRDIKPENILLESGHAVVADFGIARAISAAGGARLTETGLAIGTPAYMSPEQGTGESDLDGRSDLYALGCVAYEMLAGQPPFTGPTAQSILARHSVDAVPPLRSVRATIPVAVERAVLKALAKVPADRFASPGAFSQALVGKAEAPDTAVLSPAHSRAPRRGLLIAVAAVLVLALGIWQLLRWRSHPSANANLVAILPFRIAGANPELAWLREGMVDLLAIKLTGEGGLHAAEPRSVLSASSRVGGSGQDLTPEAALEVARRIGAGRLIDGGVVGTAGHLTLTASLLVAPSGRSSARASVEGPADSISVLVDRLAAQLLSLGAGVDASHLASIATTSLPAIRAFLAGRAAFRKGDLDEAHRSYHEATILDSTFALAALELVHTSVWVGGAWSEDAQRGKRLAQEGRSQLSAADQTLLDAWDIDDVTWPRWINAWEVASRANPERAEVWYELGDAYFHNGALMGLDDPLRLAANAFQRGWAIDSASSADSLAPESSPIVAEPLAHMVEIAQATGDTASVRRLVTLKLASDSTSWGGWYLRWHRAVALGDSARRAFWSDSQSVDPVTWRFIYQFITVYGVGTQDLARVTGMDTRLVETGHPGAVSDLHELTLQNGGRPRDADRLRLRRGDDPQWDQFDLIYRILRALYWGGDTVSAAAAASRLSALAGVNSGGQLNRHQTAALCVLSAWHVAHADYGFVETAIKRLRTAIETGITTDDPPFRPDGSAEQTATLCSELLEATRSTALHLPDARRQLEEADVAARTYRQGPILGADLMIARVAEAQGDLALALRAVRRRGDIPSYLSTFLYEEGRLAALTGDTTGAIRAYQHYLALRPNPEPEVKPEVDRVRGELARLVGEHPRP